MSLPRPAFARYLRHLRKGESPHAFHPSPPAPREPLSQEGAAAAAGYSAKNIERLEQGVGKPSAEFVEAFAEGVGLSHAEAQHLHDLYAAPNLSFSEENGAEIDGRHTTVTHVQQERLHAEALGSVLAAYVDESWNVVACNRQYARLFRHIDSPAVGNVLSWFFFVDESKEVMREWEDEARLTVAWLRALMARRPGDPRFERILDYLEASADFVRMWSYNEVILGRHKPHFLLRDLDHGVNLTLNAEVYPIPDPSQALQHYLGVPVG